MTWLPRVFGVLTAVYGLATLVRPAIFAKPAGLSGDEPPVPVGVLVRAVGVRDVANGLAMATAPAAASPSSMPTDPAPPRPAPATPGRVARALAGRAQAAPRALMRCAERPPAVRAIRGGRRAGPGG